MGDPVPYDPVPYKADDKPSLLLEHVVAIVEKTVIAEALQACNGNQVHAAQLLGIHRSTLRKKISDYRL